MLVNYEYTFDDYKKIRDHYGRWECTCPKCGACSSMYRHGLYYRNVVARKDGKLLESGGEILRLRCRYCHSTHSVLTADIIPYSSYSRPAILGLISICSSLGGTMSGTEKKMGISRQTLCRFRRKFPLPWKGYMPMLSNAYVSAVTLPK